MATPTIPLKADPNIPDERPEKTGVKWAGIALFVLSVASLAAAGYLGGLAHHAGTNVLESTAFKAFLIAGTCMLSLSIAFTIISKTHNKLSDLASGILESRIFAPFALAGIAVCVLYGVTVLGLNIEPSPWMIGATVAGGFALGILGHLPFKGKQKIEFEISALCRLFNSNHDPIYTNSNLARLYLGALPNRLTNDGENLLDPKAEEIGAVLSINEPWERLPLGLSLPYDAQHWQELGVNYQAMDMLDHQLLDVNALDQAADFINDQLNAGKNVYVHCRAGVGRSAMAVAAYLIKYVYKDEEKPVENACSRIKKSRVKSTIFNKKGRLVEFAHSLQQKGVLTTKIQYDPATNKIEEALYQANSIEKHIDRTRQAQKICTVLTLVALFSISMIAIVFKSIGCSTFTQQAVEWAIGSTIVIVVTCIALTKLIGHQFEKRAGKILFDGFLANPDGEWDQVSSKIDTKLWARFRSHAAEWKAEKKGLSKERLTKAEKKMLDFLDKQNYMDFDVEKAQKSAVTKT